MRDVWICEDYYFAEAFRAKKIQLTNRNVAFEKIHSVLEQIDMEN